MSLSFAPARLCVILLTSLFFSHSAFSADKIQLPAINLGETSFVDGIAFPGSFFQVNTIYISADRFNDSRGNKLPGDNEIDASAVLFQYADITDYKIAGGYYGWELLWGFADIEPDTSLPGLPNQGETGLGDLIISPLLIQWTDSKLWGMPYFHRFNVIFVWPVGDYDRDNQVNISSNAWRFNPYYAATLLLSPQWEASIRLHYLWNAQNNDPNPLAFNGADDIQAGSAFHANYAVSREVRPGFRVGISGYYLNQMTRDRIDGQSQLRSGEKLHGIGPGIHWKHKNTILNLDSFVDWGAENRPEGYRIAFRYAWLFH